MSDKFRKKNDHQLLMVLACGATVEAAAKQVDLTDRTIYRRLKDPDFKRRLVEVRAQMVQRAAATLTAAASEAVKTLVGLLNSQEPAPVRLGAARAILEIGIKMREVADLEQRVLDLEAKVAAVVGGGEFTPMVRDSAARSNGTPVEPPANRVDNPETP
jgi:HEAT repeat protein